MKPNTKPLMTNPDIFMLERYPNSYQGCRNPLEKRKKVEKRYTTPLITTPDIFVAEKNIMKLTRKRGK